MQITAALFGMVCWLLLCIGGFLPLTTTIEKNAWFALKRPVFLESPALCNVLVSALVVFFFFLGGSAFELVDFDYVVFCVYPMCGVEVFVVNEFFNHHDGMGYLGGFHV